MRTIYLGLICLLTAACHFPTRQILDEQADREQATPRPLAAETAGAGVPVSSGTAPAPGTPDNPLILALAPAASVDGGRIEAGKRFAELLLEETGYAFVVVVPDSYSRLVEAMGQGNAHVAVLSPYAYAYAYDLGYASAAFASLRSGEKLYGAQFIAREASGFTSYFDQGTGKNTAEAAQALAQFEEKKPCWVDEISASGYVIPSGLLAQEGITTRPAAFLQGHPAVVRAVYAGGICDFGATFIDARAFPTVRETYPDVLERVVVIWQAPPLIPYDNLSLATSLSPEIVASLQEAIFRITGTQAGREILVAAYGIEAWEPVADPFYAPFRAYLEASGIAPEDLLD